ncbi:MAG: hypothetical protein IPM34_08945 [Saprospiraceae bacterium]|nr:hypothetical protein [Saprospiraceae bacterium]
MNFKSSLIFLTILVFCCILFFNCSDQNQNEKWPSWTDRMVVYEVTPYQYLNTGGFRGITDDLERVRNLFFNTLVLHPVQVRDQANNPFNPSSQFAIQDYLKLEPSLGSEEDLLNLINKAHELGLRILMQWNIEETGPHHILKATHPNFYQSFERLVDNKFNKDFVKLKSGVEEIETFHRKTLKTFAHKYPFDGFVLYGQLAQSPNFYLDLSKSLNSDQFLFYTQTKQIRRNAAIKNKMLLDFFRGTYEKEFVPGLLTGLLDSTEAAMHFNAFIDYETNLNIGTDYTLFPNAYKYYIMFTYMIPGIPWFLNGQEFGLISAINAFDNQSLQRKYRFHEDLFRSLNYQKVNNPAMRTQASDYQISIVSYPSDIIALERISKNYYCVGVFNFTDTISSFKLQKSYSGSYDLFNKIPVNYMADTEYKLGPYQAVMFSNVP